MQQIQAEHPVVRFKVYGAIALVTAGMMGGALLLDSVLLFFVAWVVCAFAAGRYYNRRVVRWCFVVSFAFTLLPWFGAGIGNLYCDALALRLPTLALSDRSITGAVSHGLYELAATPLHLIALVSEDFDRFVHWPSGHLRPFSFFLFWLVPSVCWGGCLLLSRNVGQFNRTTKTVVGLSPGE